MGERRIVRNNNWYEPDMVVAGNLSPQKAAILLSLPLTKTSSPQEIQRFFDDIDGGGKWRPVRVDARPREHTPRRTDGGMDQSLRISASLSPRCDTRHKP